MSTRPTAYEVHVGERRAGGDVTWRLHVTTSARPYAEHVAAGLRRRGLAHRIVEIPLRRAVPTTAGGAEWHAARLKGART